MDPLCSNVYLSRCILDVPAGLAWYRKYFSVRQSLYFCFAEDTTLIILYNKCNRLGYEIHQMRRAEGEGDRNEELRSILVSIDNYLWGILEVEDWSSKVFPITGICRREEDGPWSH